MISVPPDLPEPAAQPRRGALAALIVLQLLQIASLLPWVVMAGLAVMAFDAPGSAEKWEPWAFVLAIWSYPLWLIAAGVASWICFAVKRRKTAVAIAAIFTAPAAIVAAVLVGSSVFG